MLNLTITITATPELLAAMTSLTSAITVAKMIATPEYTSDFAAHKDSTEHMAGSHNQPVPQALYQEQKSSIKQTIQAQAPAVVTPMYSQQNIVPVNQMNNLGTSGSSYSVQPEQQAPTQGVPVSTSIQSYTMEQLAVAATQLVDAGRRTELVTLLNSFGVQALTALPKEQYGIFATQLRSLGAKI